MNKPDSILDEASPLGTPSACSGLSLAQPDNPETDKKIDKGWYRRYLPHFDVSGVIQFITYRLADSLPVSLLNGIEEELKVLSAEKVQIERRKKLERLLDYGHGSGVLREKVAAECIINNWLHFHGVRYQLIAGVVMPTHVHVLLRPFAESSLSHLVQSWKSYTGKHLKRLFPEACVRGEFWMREYWDRSIRNEDHFYRTVDYIRQNPVMAGLVNSPEYWSHAMIFPLESGQVEICPSRCSEFLGEDNPLSQESARS